MIQMCMAKVKVTHQGQIENSFTYHDLHMLPSFIILMHKRPA